MTAMGSPYGIQITEDCLLCKLRTTGFFCQLPKQSLHDLERIKYASAYPQGACCLWKVKLLVASM
jgi:hypothetical protein